MLTYWYRAIDGMNIEPNDQLPQDFLSAILDDLNTPLSIKIINDYAKLVFSSNNEQEKHLYASYLLSCANFIGLMTKSVTEWFHSEVDDQYIRQLIAQRVEAKLQKNWQLADQIREKLVEDGVILEDRSDGTTIWRKREEIR